MSIKLLMLSLSASKKTEADYKWYKYTGKKPLMFKNVHRTYDLDFDQNDRFGVLATKSKVVVVHESDVSIQFKFEPKVLKRLLDASKPYKGKVNGKPVLPGPEQLDTLVKVSKPDAQPKAAAPTGTSPFKSQIREDKLVTSKLQKIKVPGMNKIKFLFAQEMLPGEVYYYYDAEPVLRQYQDKKGLQPLAYGKWEDDSERAVEKLDRTVDVEFGSARIDGKLYHLMSVIL